MLALQPQGSYDYTQHHLDVVLFGIYITPFTNYMSMDGLTAVRILGEKLGKQFVGSKVEVGVRREASGNLNIIFIKEGENVGSCLVVPEAKKAFGFITKEGLGKSSFEADLGEFVDLLKRF